MLQTSITKWLSKPKAVSQPASSDAVPLKPQQATKDNSNNHSAATTTTTPTPTPTSHTTATALPTSPPAPTPASTQQKKSSTTTTTTTTTTPARPSTTLPPLAANITLAPLTPTTLPSFRRLNTLLLPIPYPQKFYDELLTDPTTASISLAAFWHDTTSPSPAKPLLIAGIRCRLIHPGGGPGPGPLLPPTNAPDADANDARPHLYIATLATLSPYRAHGLATHLLAAVTRAAARQHGVGAVYAHVWVANEEGRAWYERRGFRVLRREEGYYRRLKPSGAWVVWRRVSVGDLLGGEVVDGEGEVKKEEG